MPGIDKATGRVIALIMLLAMTGAALRGYIPAAPHPSRRQPTGDPAGLALLAALVAVSLGILAVSFITRVRRRSAATAGIGALSTGFGGGMRRPSWRVVLVGLAALTAWLLIVWLAMGLIGRYGLDQLALVPEGREAPATGAVPYPAGTAPHPGRPRSNPGGDAFGYLAAATAGMLAVLIAGSVAAHTRRRIPKAPNRIGETPGAVAAATGVESLARAAELGLTAIGDRRREPREAIIGCYVTMEGELTHVPDAAPRDFDTPTEVLGRAVEHHALTGDNATELVELFAEARFSPHVMTEGDRERAVAALRLVVAELRSPT